MQPRGAVVTNETQPRQAVTQRRRISRAQLIVAHAVILLIIAGQALSIAFDVELWPFSPYPMYSTVRTDYSITRPTLYAVVDDGTGSEVMARDLAFFANDRAEGQLLRTYERDTDLPQLRGALADLLARYDAARANDQQAGPPVRALRLYQTAWQLSGESAAEAAPQYRALLIEVPGMVNGRAR